MKYTKTKTTLLNSRIAAVILFAVSAVFSSNSLAQDPERDLIKPEEYATKLASPLVEQDPFDLIFLDNDNDDMIMRIVPLLRPPAKPLPDRGMLRFEFKGESDNIFQVPWDHVVDYKTFNELLIEEADEWLNEGDYPRAFRNLLYVYDHGGQNDDRIVNSLLECLYQDGKASFMEERYELALSIYEDIYAKNPNFRVHGLNRSLSQIIMACYEGILRRNFTEGNILRVRGLLQQIEDTYKDESEELIETWNQRFIDRSNELIEEAFQHAANGDGVAAHDAVRFANNIYPGRIENANAYNEVVRQFPLIFVGVASGPGDANPTRMDNWGSRRIGRLTQRTLVEFDGTSDEGGRYRFLNGLITQTDDAGTEFRIDVDPDNFGFAIPDTTAGDVALRLQSFADPQSVNYNVPWAKLARTIAIDNGNEVHLRLHKPFVRPEAHFQIPYQEPDDEGQPVQNGAYVMSAVKDDLTLYELNPLYSPSADRQHPKIYERRFDSSSAAVESLLKGDIDVVDRVPVQFVQELKEHPEITVQMYALPTVHMLIPNQRNEFISDINFRNGLLHAINRELIVRDMICAGKEISGCEVVSGPFPIGTEDNDQIAYGYNLRVRNTEYNYKLGMVLAQIITERLEALEREAGNDKPVIERPPIVLAHPTDDTSMIAVRAIARMWSEIGMTVLLKPIENDGTLPTDEDWDFLYMGVTMQEPMTDAHRLMGPEGFVGEVSATVEQLLRSLSTARSWQRGCLTLRQIHRQTANQVTLLPLFQVNEYYAYRSTVREVGSELVHLYQDVERWRIQPIVTQEQEQDP
ncbi:MAG: ABC transporter substrate-binding protein [Planctomycetota bacterium]